MPASLPVVTSSLDAALFGWSLNVKITLNQINAPIAIAILKKLPPSDFNHLAEFISDLSPVVRVGISASTSSQWNEEKVECLKKAQEVCLVYRGSKFEHERSCFGVFCLNNEQSRCEIKEIKNATTTLLGGVLPTSMQHTYKTTPMSTFHSIEMCWLTLFVAL